MVMTLDSVDLADDPDLAGEQLEWVDRYEWDAVEQTQERSLAGNLILQEGVKVYGRPITLASNAAAWFTLAKVRELEVLRDQVGKVMLLTLPDGEQHHVTWNRTAGAPVQAVPLFRRVVYQLDDLFTLTLRLITVAPPPAP
ncbi:MULTISPECIES: hypothetical protein [unclassified Pseudomonas]|uniref:hypothetical protein n=1 Tax=unclassified Pseudomonas TaxID=196821 RepID=UPI00244B6E4A|nr:MULTISPECIES: hypothetical protein [unclassified Pseudomonas]MDG9925431.1 hypothetical protein [Pseudomonas sp. GD04045]MDH0034128.1 hypothetical protein [Pseudomonas sp. GD04019]